MFGYLNSKRKLDILAKKRVIIETELLPRSPVISDMPKGKGGDFDNYVNYIDKLDKLSREYTKEYRNAINKMQQIDDIISKVDDDLLRLVLNYRYILGNRWEVIADTLNYSTRQVLRLRKEALSAVEKLLDDCK